MSYLVDTNLLLRLAQPKNPHQREVVRSLRALRRQKESLAIIPQNLIEFWGVATRPHADNGLGLTIDETAKLIGKLKNLFTVLPDNSDIFLQWEQIVIRHRVSGKQVHDARLVAAMLVHDVTHLLTFNTDDFKRFSEITVVNPQNVT
jgi:predicted nucleic acid-binding protein